MTSYIRQDEQMFRILKKAILYILVLTALISISGYIYLYVLPKGPNVTASIPVSEGKDTFVMYAYKNCEQKSIKVWTYRPSKWQNEDKIVFVMHGGGRNADDYLDAWIEIAEENNLFIVAPEFENKFSKYMTNDYQEGNLYTFFGTKNPKEEWVYTVVENIFDHIKSFNSITNQHYDIFGHSAGGQFVHRMILLMPLTRIGMAVSANSGFYTLPDEDFEFPYGIENTALDLESDFSDSYRKRLVILLGALDNNESLGTFRTTDLAMKQGANRLERGTNFYNLNRELANNRNWLFNWNIDTVPNVGHDYMEMSKSAVEWITNEPS